ncbi:MAG: hypothetical protein RL328_2870, partial [Acidobacteriota bacterium]
MANSNSAPIKVRDMLDLTGRIVIITGGGGLLGRKHAEAVAEMGGLPILIDINEKAAAAAAAAVQAATGGRAEAARCDITSPAALAALRDELLAQHGRIDALVNNAANNPKVEGGTGGKGHFSRLEQFSLDAWRQDVEVGLTGAFLCVQAFGPAMAKAGRGVILNIASDLAVIAPDQRLYRQPGRAPEDQPVKPVTYSVVKAGLLGLTRYVA